MINLENLRVLSRNNDDFIREILEVYLTNTPRDIESMRAALSNEDWQTVRYFAHKLKSSSFTIGFIEAHGIFQQIEYAIRDNPIKPEVDHLVQHAIERCEACYVEIRLEMNNAV